MKIGIVTDAIDDNAAGIGTYVRYLVPWLQKIDKNNTYVCIHHSSSSDSFYEGKEELIIPIKSFPLAREWRKIFTMPHILKKQQFDLVHDPAQFGPFFFRIPYKKVLTICDLVPLILPKTQPGFSVFHHKYGLRFMLRKVDKIISISHSTKRDIVKYCGVLSKKITVTHLAADKQFKQVTDIKELDAFKETFFISQPYVLFVGTLEPRKNVGRLLLAWWLVAKKYPGTMLYIIGRKGWKYQHIFSICDKLGLRDRVRFLHGVKWRDLPLFYACAELFVYPSLYEGFGLPVLEAMQCGTPVVTSHNSSLPEVGGDAVVYCNPYEPKDIADAICSVLQNPGMKANLVKKASAQRKKFSWEQCAVETLAVYKDLLSQNSNNAKSRKNT